MESGMSEVAYAIPQPEEREERNLIVGFFYDRDGVRHEYAYVAVGFAYERVERMLNPSRRGRIE